VLKDRDQAQARLVHLEHGEPVLFGSAEEQKAVVRAESGGVEAVPVAELGSRVPLVHDAQNDDPAQAFALSRLDGVDMAHVPVGVFRSVTRPTYDDLVREQVTAAQDAAGGPATDADLAALLAGSDTWTVGAGA
jgi:2-oxoglutarate ferredoxin oxidoreductase subunit beta